MKGKQFFNPLVLQIFSSIFKHTVGNAPPSFPQIGHPIVALALTCVAVSCPLFNSKYVMNMIKPKIECTVRIWAEGIYDAGTRKIVAKITPLSNKPSKETAFSFTIWANATNMYVKKIIMRFGRN